MKLASKTRGKTNMNFGQVVQQQQRMPFLYEGTFALQQQLTIVDPQGQVAAVPAATLGVSPYMTLNEAGTQVAFRTDPFTVLTAGIAQLQALKQTVFAALPEQRLLWPLNQVTGATTAAGQQLRFTLPRRLMVHLFDDYYHDYFENYVAFQNQIYLQLAQNIQAYQFVLTTLFGTQPAERETDYTTLARYLKTVQMVDGTSSVIFGGELPDQLAARGIHYIELTTLGFVPEQVDLSATQLAFLKAFIVFCLVTSAQPTTFKAFQQAFKTFMADYQVPAALQAASQSVLTAPAVATVQQSVGLKWAQQYAQQFRLPAPILAGYQTLSLDTQLLMKTAYQAGCQVALIDKQAEIVKLQHQQPTWLKAGLLPFNQQLTTALLADKWFLKQQLGQAGFHVVLGNHYQSVTAAVADFPDYAQQALVVKPRTASASQGLTIFRLPPQPAEFAAAVKRALAVADDCLVESFTPGTIYRFLVLDQQILAVNEEAPANVVGDGRQTIAQLVQRKNQKRGVQRPWQPIPLDDQTTFDLQQQGLTVASIPQRGNPAYLRLAASWITGADEIESRSEVDQSYQKLVLQITQHLNLRYGSVTLAIANPYQTYQADQPTQLAVIDVDSMPHLTAFEVPFFGEAAQPAQQIMKTLVQP
jgi:D-alanine-D-alanine ligase-like ATP-grasp enzyme